MKTMSLRARLTSWYTLALLVALIVFGINVLWQQKRVGTRRVDRELEALLATLESVVREELRRKGAGLSVLAAADPDTKAVLGGGVGLGLPDRNELGWRWKDSLIYLTHRPPNEPAFSSSGLVAAVAPLPLALMVSTHDEFVPLAETQRIFARASEPKRLWVVDAVNHRFSNNLPEFDARLMEAIAWVQHNQSR